MNTRIRSNFDFAISFAGTDRSIAEQLFSLLTARGAYVFLDSQFRSHLLGRRLDQEFARIFGPGTKYFIPIISHSYINRSWPQHEWTVAIREANRREPQEFILPLRLDDSIIFGLPNTIAYIDLREHSINDVADLLIEKLTGITLIEVVRWVATFGLLIEDVLESGNLPSTAPTYYPHLCDWLTEDLLIRLEDSSISNPRIIEDSRDGEVLSVRVEFEWKPQEVHLDFGVLGWWEVFEVLPYDHIY
jgi:hypothetical protein